MPLALTAVVVPAWIPAPAAVLVFDRVVTQESPYYTDIALDTSGNLHLCGFAVSEGIPRALVTKRSPDGAVEIWSLQFGGSPGQIATGIDVDALGNVHVAGWTGDPQFPLEKPLQGTFGGGESDLFVLTIDPSGSRLLFSTFFGGNGNDFANQVRVDPTGNLHVTGTTFSDAFPGADSPRGGDSDAFVIKIHPAGTGLMFSRRLGGSGTDLGNGLSLDPHGRALVIGSTASTDFPVVAPLQAQNRGTQDAFIAILGAGGQIEYATYLGGSRAEYGTGISTDLLGNIYVTGATFSPDFPLQRAFQASLREEDCPANQPCGDAFVAKLNPAGSSLEFSTYLGGNGEENPNALTSGAGFALYGIDTDALGFAYVTGTSGSQDFPLFGGLQVMRRRGSTDPFLVKFQPDGGVVYSTYVSPGPFRPGEIRYNYGSSLAVTPSGDAFLAGVSLPRQVGPGAGSGPAGFLAQVFDLPVIPAPFVSTDPPGTGGTTNRLRITELRRLADRSSQLTFLVPTNSGYAVEASTDFRRWDPLFTNAPQGGGVIRQ